MSAITDTQRSTVMTEQLDPLDKATQAFVVIGCLSVLTIIVLTALSMTAYIEDPLLPLYITPVPLTCLAIIKILEWVQIDIAKKNGISFQDYQLVRHPIPKKEKK